MKENVQIYVDRVKFTNLAMLACLSILGVKNFSLHLIYISKYAMYRVNYIYFFYVYKFNPVLYNVYKIGVYQHLK